MLKKMWSIAPTALLTLAVAAPAFAAEDEGGLAVRGLLALAAGFTLETDIGSRPINKIDRLSDPDFYVKVIINNEEFTSPIWDDTKYVYIPDWSATQMFQMM